ncbi:MAG: hypothetical protein HKN17_10675 [Rhodothermales bacterium]|nr:hypothetical protein [Rhodothermales bacterium]
MGQQQLLLLVLGIVIVGLAVVVGIQAFTENMKKSNSDALVNDAIRIASDAQAWKLKPAAFGGGADVTGWTGFTLEQVGYSTEDGDNGDCAAGEYGNLNGCFTVAAGAANVVITAVSLPDSDNDNQAVVTVTGTTPADISTAVSTVDDASGS